MTSAAVGEVSEPVAREEDPVVSENALSRVLFVDDEPRVLEIIRLNFARYYDVHTAEGGQEALDLISESPDPFSVIVTDMRMPGMNGADLLSRVRSLSPNTVRLVLTGYTDMDTALSAVHNGYVFRFLQKPCSPRELKNAVDDAIEQYRLISRDRELIREKVEAQVGRWLRAERLATVENLASAIGRDLKNQAIVLSVVLDRMESAESDLDAESIADLRGVAEQLGNHGMNLSRLQGCSTEKPAPIPILAVLRDVVEAAKLVAPACNISLEVTAPPGVVTVGHRRQLEQGLHNLIRNALDAVESQEGSQPKVNVLLASDKAEALVSIVDNGIGIPAANMNSIYEPYYSSKPSSQGAGLGLVVTRSRGRRDGRSPEDYECRGRVNPRRGAIASGKRRLIARVFGLRA